MENTTVTLSAFPYSQSVVEAGLVQADAILSIVGSSDEPALLDSSSFSYGTLRLKFDDIPWREWTDRRGHKWIGPTPEDVSQAILFSRSIRKSGGSLIAVHCLHGKSRSAAIALAITADAMGSGKEASALSIILEKDTSHHMCFNPGLVRMADAFLDNGGALEAALEVSCRRFLTWRSYWEERTGLPKR